MLIAGNNAVSIFLFAHAPHGGKPRMAVVQAFHTGCRLIVDESKCIQNINYPKQKSRNKSKIRWTYNEYNKKDSFDNKQIDEAMKNLL